MSAPAMPRCDFDRNNLLLKANFVVSADPKSIDPIINTVLAIAAEMKCAQGKELEIDLALREALANAIKHGCGGDETKQVQCCIACDQSRGMLLVVRDPGEGFDPASIPSPIVGQNLYSEHGRGLFLINQLMDEVRYERGGTEIHMRKN